MRCYELVVLGLRGGGTKVHAISASWSVVWQVLGRRLLIAWEVQT